MSDMAPLFSLFAIIPVILGGFYYYAHQRTLGSLDITTSSVAYNRTRYHDILDWDKYALTIEGEPTQILSGEFHYWRVPDRERWTPILKQYRSAGFNSIRIYFHWGYHSPADGVYHFDGNRDIDYLLTLCEELGLFVLAAPGPYICAETQAGGYPGWVVAKRDLNIRHNFMMLWRIYDAKFANYEIQWMNAILPILAKHQITENKGDKKGCVLGIQIDNELFETMNGMLPVGLHDQMRVLAKAARDAGITVPLFTNDGFEEGGWVPRPELDNKKGKKRFGIDLYGFDKYVIFAPSSSPKSWLINSGVSVGDWDEWDPKNMENSMDKLEKKIRGFGGGAKESPIFIPELQGGWFNHYQLQHTYDQIFDFYGEEYTKLLVETSLAQGVTMASVYMIYGGTNWGTLGDPDVYTSYDYSACIREFGMLSSRGRNLRKTLLLTRSFDPYFTKTDRVTNPNVKTSIPHTLNLQRQSVADQPVTFTFFRNFDRQKRETFDVTIDEKEGSLTMGCYLPYKTSFIAVGNYTTQNDLHLIMSTIPILSRIVDKENKQEIWIVEPNIVGGMAFKNKEVTLTGNMQDNTLRVDGPSIILSFEKDHGWTKIESTTGSLYIIGLTKQDASTVFAEFEEPYWNNGQKKYPAFVAWGADNFYFNKQSQKLEVNHRPSETEVHVVSLEPMTDIRLTKSTGAYDLPFIQSFEFDEDTKSPLPVSIDFNKFESRTAVFKDMPWEPLKSFKKNGNVSFDAIDYQYLSGHVLYRNQFKTPDEENPKVILTLTARHRATVLVNGKIVGGHTTYSRQLYMPGAKIGPDPWFLGKHTYDLTPYLSHTEQLENELIVIVESFGLNRQAFIMNDIRNPRGITGAKLKGAKEESGWEISGVDIRKLSNPFISTGFPDEHETTGWKQLDQVVEKENVYKIPISVSQGAQWFRFRFDNALKKSSSSYNVPLRLHMNGEWTAMVSINDVLIARYYGNGDGPQHDFYLPDDLIKAKDNEVKILAYTWTDTEGEFSIAGWPVLAGSGNLITHYEEDHKPAEYMVYKDQIKF